MTKSPLGMIDKDFCDSQEAENSSTSSTALA
jgi:hypothetical protein